MSIVGAILITLGWIVFCIVVAGNDGVGLGVVSAAMGWLIGGGIWLMVS